jgi:hypothetical protein
LEAVRFEAVETLRDGRPVKIRALRPDDRAGPLAAVNRSNAQSLYRRLFSPTHDFTPKEIAYFTDVDFAPEEQEQRLRARINDGRKIWKLSKMDLQSFSRWDDYTRVRDEMFMATDTAWAPWFVAQSDDKRRARLNIIEHLLANIPYKRVPRAQVRLPARHIAAGDQARRPPLKIIAEVH